MKIELEIKDNELEWENNSSLKLVHTSKTLITIEANKEGLISLAKQLLTITYSENGYIKFFGTGKKGSEFAFVGLKNTGANISTFGIRNISDLAKKIPWIIR